MRPGEGLEEELPYGSETILVVEDENDLRKIAVQILQKHGIKFWKLLKGMRPCSSVKSMRAHPSAAHGCGHAWDEWP